VDRPRPRLRGTRVTIIPAGGILLRRRRRPDSLLTAPDAPAEVPRLGGIPHPINIRRTTERKGVEFSLQTEIENIKPYSYCKTVR